MTPNETLRAMLDERGVEWRGADRDVRTWFDVDGILWFVLEHSDGNLSANAVFLTPEQAIAATLGPGTCHLIDTQFPTGDDSYFKACSGCGFWIYNRYNWENTRFCPHCGRKVVDA